MLQSSPRADYQDSSDEEEQPVYKQQANTTSKSARAPEAKPEAAEQEPEAEPLKNRLPPLPERPTASKRRAVSNKSSPASTSTKDESKAAKSPEQHSSTDPEPGEFDLDYCVLADAAFSDTLLFTILLDVQILLLSLLKMTQKMKQKLTKGMVSYHLVTIAAEQRLLKASRIAVTISASLQSHMSSFVWLCDTDIALSIFVTS